MVLSDNRANPPPYPPLAMPMISSNQPLPPVEMLHRLMCSYMAVINSCIRLDQ